MIAWPAAGRVHDDQVGGALEVEALHLAEHEDVLHAGNRGRHDVEGAGLHQPLGDPLEPVVLEPVDQCRVRRQGARPDSLGQLALLVAEIRAVERGREPRFALDLHDQHAHARARSRDRERRGDRGLADTPLARHDDDPGSGAELRELHCPDATGALMHRLSWADSSGVARRARRVLLSVVLAALGLVLLAPDAPAGALPRATRDDSRAGITVIQVDGLIDPPNAQLIRDSIRDANRRPTSLLVVKFASGGAVDVDPGPLVRAIRELTSPGGGVGRPGGRQGQGHRRVARDCGVGGGGVE